MGVVKDPSSDSKTNNIYNSMNSTPNLSHSFPPLIYEDVEILIIEFDKLDDCISFSE